jgi:hypothetical protein
MSGIITSSSFAKLLWPGINALYGKAYNDYPQEWKSLGFEMNKSSKAYEEDVGLSSFGLAGVKSEGGPISYDTERQGFTTRYNHVVYALGFIVTREIYEDDQYDQVCKRKAGALARSMNQTKEIVAANIFNRMTDTNYLGGDGSPLISTTHANVSGGSWSNSPATAADMSEASLEQAVIDIAAFRDDRGLLIACKPKKLIVRPDLQFETKRILGSEGRIGTDNNDLNAIKTMGVIPEVVINHYLTDVDQWTIITDVQDGLKHFERRADQFEMDNDFDTENAKYKATGRYSFGWSDPRCAYGSIGV